MTYLLYVQNVSLGTFLSYLERFAKALFVCKAFKGILTGISFDIGNYNIATCEQKQKTKKTHQF